MRCLDDATALSFARGELDAGTLEPVIEHIGTCTDCRLLVAAAAATSVTPAGRSGRVPGAGPLPAMIARFRVEGVAGHGAMGIVYRGRDDRLDRPVALKLIHPALLGSQAHARLEREARALAKVDHPAVVGVYEVGDIEGSLYVAMEYIDGGTLEAWLAGEPRSADAILVRFIQAGEGLLAAHRAGLVHRDFKPSNAMLDERGDVHVTDFGLVSEGRPEAGVDQASPADLTHLALTQTGAVVGTPAYMAPEQLEAKSPDPRSDQFSFCVALFEALAGHRPFEAQTYEDLRAALHGGQPASPRRPIPAGVHAALLRGLAIEPEDRFPSMRELLDALAATPARSRLGPRLGWVAGLAGAGLLGLAVLAWSSGGPERGGDELSEQTEDPDTPALADTPAAGVAPPLPEAPGDDEPSAPRDDRAASACDPLTARWEEVWTDTRKSTLRAFETSKWPATPPKHAKAKVVENWAGLGRVRGSFAVDDVRRFGDTWRSLVDQTCADPGAQHSSSNKLRRACLNDTLTRLDALILSPPREGRFGVALEPLTDRLNRCSTHMVEALTLPADEAWTLVEGARRQLAQASAARTDRRLVEALALCDEAISAGEAAADAPVLAEAWLGRGRVLSLSARSEDAIEALHEAVSYAQQAMYHRVLREASEDLAWEYLFGAEEPRQARRWLETSARLDARVSPTDLELSRRAFMRAHLALGEGEHAAAIEHLRGMMDDKPGPALARGVLTTWLASLEASGADAAAREAVLDDFARRYSLEPGLLATIESLRGARAG